MKRASKSLCALRIDLCFALLASSLICAAQPAPSLLHKPAPPFARPDLSGKRIDLAAFRGKVVLLNFWATWCGPCQVELPQFAKWQRQYGPRGLEVIAVSMDDDPAPVREMVRRLQLDYPIILGDEQLGTEYGGILGLPITYLVSRGGSISARFEGAANLSLMEHEVRKLLKER